MRFKIIAIINLKKILLNSNNAKKGIKKLKVSAFHIKSQYELELKKDKSFLR
jgi:hypothetical protein